jgi:hypothetical protein
MELIEFIAVALAIVMALLVAGTFGALVFATSR